MNREIKNNNGMSYELVSMDTFSPDLKIYQVKWKFFTTLILTNNKIYTIKYEIDEVSDILLSFLKVDERANIMNESLEFKTMEEAENFVISIYKRFKDYINLEER